MGNGAVHHYLKTQIEKICAHSTTTFPALHRPGCDRVCNSFYDVGGTTDDVIQIAKRATG
jgi:hypothetical protein